MSPKHFLEGARKAKRTTKNNNNRLKFAQNSKFVLIASLIICHFHVEIWLGKLWHINRRWQNGSKFIVDTSSSRLLYGCWWYRRYRRQSRKSFRSDRLQMHNTRWYRPLWYVVDRLWLQRFLYDDCTFFRVNIFLLHHLFIGITKFRSRRFVDEVTMVTSKRIIFRHLSLINQLLGFLTQTGNRMLN